MLEEERERRQPRNLGTDESSRAKIGVIQVSCSCGKWSPIDADDPEPLPPPNSRKPFVVLIDHNGLVLQILYLLGLLYQDCASSANSNPGAGEHKDQLLGN